MELKTFVKVGNISNLSDARYCAGFGVNALGFNIEPANNEAISLQHVKEIIGWVAVENIVLECGQMLIEELREVIEESGINFIQIDYTSAISTLVDTSFIYRHLISNEDDVVALTKLSISGNNCKYVLIECDNTDLFAAIDSAIGRSKLSIPLLKGYGIDTTNLNDTIAHDSPFFGIAIKGSEEEKPGYKEYDDLAEILESLENDE